MPLTALIIATGCSDCQMFLPISTPTAPHLMELIQQGMLVDNKAFTGEHMKIDGRATFVLVKQPTWKIAHIHLSKIEG